MSVYEKIKNNIVIGKNVRPSGVLPAVALINPRFEHNVGSSIRAASCFGIKQVWFTGSRIKLEDRERLPREERMKGYQDVTLIQYDYFLEQFKDATPVAVEVDPTAEVLTVFEHPENAIYIFGPEDGNVPQVIRQHCHRFVTIPTKHCTNLSAAVYITLYDRLMKRQQLGLEPVLPASAVLNEPRGFGAFEEFKKQGSLNGRNLNV
jgi:tRNA(Leu) C34 or U34 (ribose-2'-O)-methylase TrmL